MYHSSNYILSLCNMYMLITVAEIPTTTQEIGELTTLTLEYAWLNMHDVEYTVLLNMHG